MQTFEVPTHEWVPFLDEFSKRHQGQPVTLELIGRAIGAQVEAKSLPLMGVSVDVKGNECEQIEVSVGDSPEHYVMHAIERPSCLRVARNDRGDDRALQIESERGPMALLRLDPKQSVPS